MRKILGEAFAEKCRQLLRVPGADMYSVARKLNCSYSTVYRATGGKRRACELPKKQQTEWAEATRKARTTSKQRKRNTGMSKVEHRQRLGRKRGECAAPRRNRIAANQAKRARIEAKRAALRAS